MNDVYEHNEMDQKLICDPMIMMNMKLYMIMRNDLVNGAMTQGPFIQASDEIQMPIDK